MRLALCSLLLSALVSAPTAALAQQPPTSAATAVMIQILENNLKILGNDLSACPVGIAAQRQASGQTEWIISLEDGPHATRSDARRPNQAGVHVELDAAVGPGKDKLMAQAEVAVFYMSPGIRMTPAIQAGTAPNRSSMKKTFILTAADGGSASKLSGTLLVGAASTITRVRLLSITYSDGSTWHPETGSSCSVSPSGLLLLSAVR